MNLTWMDGDSEWSFASKKVMTTQRCAGAHDRYEIYRTNARKSRRRVNLGGKEGCVCVWKLILIIEQIDGGAIYDM